MSVIKNIVILITLVIININCYSQNDSVNIKELNEFSASVNSKFRPPKDVLSKIRTEMYFVLVHIRDSVVNSFEVFSSSDTILKTAIHDYFLLTVNKYKFRHIKNHDYILPIIIKNIAPVQGKPVLNTDYDYLLWKSKRPKKFNRLDEIIGLPQFIYRDSKSQTGSESLSPKSTIVQ